MKTIANFLEVDPMLSPSVHDNSDISHIPTPQTPPRESLNNKPVNENTMFQVNTPSREEWQEMLNSSQLSNTNGVLPSGNNDDVKKTNTDGDVVKEEIYEDESSLNLSRLSRDLNFLLLPSCFLPLCSRSLLSSLNDIFFPGYKIFSISLHFRLSLLVT